MKYNFFYCKFATIYDPGPQNQNKCQFFEIEIYISSES